MLNLDQIHFKDSEGEFNSLSDVLSSTDNISLGTGNGPIALEGTSLTFNGESFDTTWLNRAESQVSKVTFGTNLSVDCPWQVTLDQPGEGSPRVGLLAYEDRISLYDHETQAFYWTLNPSQLVSINLPKYCGQAKIGRDDSVSQWVKVLTYAPDNPYDNYVFVTAGTYMGLFKGLDSTWVFQADYDTLGNVKVTG